MILYPHCKTKTSLIANLRSFKEFASVGVVFAPYRIHEIQYVPRMHEN